MIRYSSSIFVIVFLLTSSVSIYADVVMGNSFLYKNEGKTKQLGERYNGKRFVVNSLVGYIVPKIEPGSEEGVSTGVSYAQFAEDVFTFGNGWIIWISNTYLHNGEYWGVMEPSHAYQPPGWFPMDELLMFYDREEFELENKDNFYQYSGSYNAVLSAERLVEWQWPGSDREKRIIENKDTIVNCGKVTYAYKDEEGREWGKTSYTEGWICLTDPENSKIPAFHPAPKPAKWSPDGVEWIYDDDGSDNNLEQYQLSNVTKVRTYEPNKTFTDIEENAWYQYAVATAYEYGIMKGAGDNKFDHSGNLTVAECVTIASRIHSYYKYGKEIGGMKINEYNSLYNSAGGWSNFGMWGGAIRYCTDEGLIINSSGIHHLTPITRAELIGVWAKILQSKDMPKQNTVIGLPDVTADTPYYEDIVLFYEAGIIGGIDDKGTFHPDSDITRAEATTIFMNLIDLTKRHSGRTYGK